MRVHLITAESPASRRLRQGRLIQFPQLTMPLIAALTPREHKVSHTDEIMSPAELEAGTEWVARRLYSPRSIVRRLAGSRAGVWWNLPRNVGYMLAGLSNAGPSWDPAEHERSSGGQIPFSTVQR